MGFNSWSRTNSKNNNGWYEEQLDDNFYRWTYFETKNIDGSTFSSWYNLQISPTQKIPVPNNISSTYKTVESDSNKTSWLINDGYGQFRFATPGSQANSTFVSRLTYVVYGSKN